MKASPFLLVTCLLLNITLSFSQPGKIDSSFGVNGQALFSDGNIEAYSVDMQGNGKIIVAGLYYTSSTNSDCLLLRYLPNGMPDSSFGINGKVITDFGGDDLIYKIAIQQDGKIIAAGPIGLVRYEKDGELDSSFGLNGVALINENTDYGFGALDIAKDGKIVAGVASGSSPYYKSLAVRFNQNGTPDSTFGVNGEVITDFGANTGPTSIIIEPNGKILVAESSNDDSTASHSDVAVVRYLDNGNIDSSFGLDGKIIINYLSYYGQYAFMVKLQNGKIVVAENYIDEYFYYTLHKYTANGEPDTSFGDNGVVYSPDDYKNHFAYFLIQDRYKILVGGFISDKIFSNSDIELSEYNQGGAINKTFGDNGLVHTHFSYYDFGIAGVRQRDEKIVVLNYYYGLIRYYGHYNPIPVIKGHIRSLNTQQQNSISSNIHLSPNPVKDGLHIDGLSDSKKTISIVDIKGNVVQQTTTASSSYSFNIQQLAAGIYFIRIDEGDKTKTLKFIRGN